MRSFASGHENLYTEHANARNDFVGGIGTVVSGSATHLGPQSQLGRDAQWRAGVGFVGRGGAVAHGKDLGILS